MTFEFEYLGEFTFKFEIFLDPETGSQMGLIDEKKLRSKISCKCTFKTGLLLFTPIPSMVKRSEKTFISFHFEAKQSKKTFISFCFEAKTKIFWKRNKTKIRSINFT
jgi:hypothetical protein